MSAPAAVARLAADAISSTFPSMSPTVVFSWPSAIRTTKGSLRGRLAVQGRRLLRATDVDVVSLPHQVRAVLAMPHDQTQQALEVVAARVHGPRVRPGLARLEPVEGRPDLSLDDGVLLLQAPHIARESRRPRRDLVIETLGLLGDEHVLLERVAEAHELLPDLGAPLGRPPGRGGGNRLLQVNELIVQRRTAAFGRLQRRGEIGPRVPLGLHAVTVAGGRPEEQVGRVSAVDTTHTVTAFSADWSKGTTINDGEHTGFTFDSADTCEFRCRILSTRTNGACVQRNVRQGRRDLTVLDRVPRRSGSPGGRLAGKIRDTARRYP